MGRNDDGTINNSYAASTVSSSAGASFPNFGGLVGIHNAGMISDSYWDVTTSGLGVTAGCGNTVSCSGATGLTTTEMQDGSSAALDDGFQLNAGEYPKVFQCTTCTGAITDFVYSSDLVPGQ